MRLGFGSVFCIQSIETVSGVCPVIITIIIGDIGHLGFSDYSIIYLRIYGQTRKFCISYNLNVTINTAYSIYKTIIQQGWVGTYRGDLFPFHLHFPSEPVFCQELTNEKSYTCKLVVFFLYITVTIRIPKECFLLLSSGRKFQFSRKTFFVYQCAWFRYISKYE